MWAAWPGSAPISASTVCGWWHPAAIPSARKPGGWRCMGWSCWSGPASGQPWRPPSPTAIGWWPPAAVWRVRPYPCCPPPMPWPGCWRDPLHPRPIRCLSRWGRRAPWCSAGRTGGWPTGNCCRPAGCCRSARAPPIPPSTSPMRWRWCCMSCTRSAGASGRWPPPLPRQRPGVPWSGPIPAAATTLRPPWPMRRRCCWRWASCCPTPAGPGWPSCGRCCSAPR